MKAASHEALFGLLAVTGMRLGEAIALERDDVDLTTASSRSAHTPPSWSAHGWVPLHPTTVEALERYAKARAGLCPRPRAESYWYLTTTPELMNSAAQRLEQHLGGRP